MDDVWECAREGDVLGLKRMLAASDGKDWINKRDDSRHGWTPLHLASRNGHLEVVKFLQSFGADICCADNQGYTPLHYASITGHLEVIKLLLSAGANIDCFNNRGESPVGDAFRRGHITVVEIFIEMEEMGELSFQDRGSLLHVVCKEKLLKPNLLKKLLERGQDISKRDKHDKQPVDYLPDEEKSMVLHVASDVGNLEAVKISLALRVFVDYFDKNGFSPIGIAFRMGHITVVETFIDMEEKGELCFQDGGSLLHVVCREKLFKLTLLKMLLARGYDISKRDKHGRQPGDYLPDEDKNLVLHLVSSVGHLEAVKTLVSSGADIYWPDLWGEIPVYKACQNGHLEVVKVLLSASADFGCSSEGMVSLQCAITDKQVGEIDHCLLHKIPKDKGLGALLSQNNSLADVFIKHLKWHRRKNFMMFLSTLGYLSRSGDYVNAQEWLDRVLLLSPVHRVMMTEDLQRLVVLYL